MEGQKKLLSMVEYTRMKIKNFYDTTHYDNSSKKGDLIEELDNYAQFLLQNLIIGMFIPCDLDGNILVNPSTYAYEESEAVADLYKEWEEAQSRVLFSGFKIEYFNLGGGEVNTNSSFQIISEDNKVQICVYKAQPDYFIWNNGGTKVHPTVEYLVKHNLTLNN